VHVLTKLFIVLVSLLAVLLTPLVVVYAYNENSYKARYQEQVLRAATAVEALTAEQRMNAVEVNQLTGGLREVEASKAQVQRELDNALADLRRTETRLAASESMQVDFQAKLDTLIKAVESGQLLTSGLIQELGTLRNDALVRERQKVELDEALRETVAQLETANEARRALQEELQRLTVEHGETLNTLSEIFVNNPQLRSQPVAVGMMRADVDLDATVLSVRTSNNAKYAEIDAGSRDGVKVGWTLAIAFGGQFVANLRITEVDINRSVGVVELENAKSGLTVQVGHTAYARRMN
jgi:hypothetical protein